MAASLCRRGFLHLKNSIFKLQCRNHTGYIVLIPEAPDDVAQNEIFTKTGHSLEFDKITPKDCKTLMVRKSQIYDVGAWELNVEITNMLEKNEKIDVFKYIFGPLEVLYVPFCSAWGLISTLKYANSDLMPLKEFHPLQTRAVEIRSDKFKVDSIFKVCKESLEKEPDKYKPEEKRILEKFYWEGKISGLDIEEKDKKEYSYLIQRINMRMRDYNEKWLNSTLQLKQVIFDPRVTNDFPPDLIRNIANDVEEPEKGPWVLSLYPKVYNRFMEYCPVRQSRLHMWLSKRQVCSKHGDQRFRAELEVEDLRMQRAKLAKLLGFPTYAHMQMKTRMAADLESIHDMLEVLLEKAKIGQENEIHDLENFARGHGFLAQIELWDIAYWERMQKKELFQFDEISLQEYFPLSQVLLGLFALCEQLFGIVIEEEKHANAWHPDVRYFHVYDERTKKDLGGFYFDPYARKTKDLGPDSDALCVILGVGSKICNTLPSVALLFNLAPPKPERPTLLLFSEVKKLFYQFGYALQHILTDTEYTEAGSHTYMEKDAVQICAKFLSHWVYERGTLESVSGHYNTGEPLPAHILDGIGNMQHHLAGTKLCIDIYKAHLDFQLHIDDECCMPIVERLWPEHFLFNLLDCDHHPFGMKDIFIEGNACNHYSKIWSDVIAADIFDSFQEAGFKNHEEISQIGRRFRSTYFALGGGLHPKEVFYQFRGRNPSPLPFLSQIGLKDLAPNLSPSTEPTKIAAN